MSPFYFGTRERRLFGIYEPASMRDRWRIARRFCAIPGAQNICMRIEPCANWRSSSRPQGSIPCGSTFSAPAIPVAKLSTPISRLGKPTSKWRWKKSERSLAQAASPLIGLRLGAAVAATVAADNKVDALVLWDPVVSGKEYLNQLGVAGDAEPPIEIQGFPLAEKMLRDLRAFELNRLILKRLPRTLMLMTERLPSHGSLMSSATCSASLDFMTDVHPWSAGAFTNGMVPYKVIQRILAWLE